MQPLLQGIVDCAYDQSIVFGFLRPGSGQIKITAKVGKGQKLSCRLQTIDRVRLFWRVLEKLLENLQCCDNLICGRKIKGLCPLCNGKTGMFVECGYEWIMKGNGRWMDEQMH